MDERICCCAGAALLVLLAACTATPPVGSDGAGSSATMTPDLVYPPAQRGDQRDDYHGTMVADPYRWLEQVNAPATQAWVAAQNALTQEVLAGLPMRDRFARSLAELIDYERSGVPQHESGVYVFEHNSGHQEQDVVRVSDDDRSLGRILLDPNLMAADGSLTVADYRLSPDGRLLAWALSVGGSDWNSWHVLDVASGEDLSDRIDGTKFSGVAWLPDASGFVYSRYPRSGDAFDDDGQVRVYLHRVGDPQSADSLIFAVDDHPTRNPYGEITDDGRFLVISLFDGYETSGVYYLRWQDNRPSGKPVRLLDVWDARYEFLGNSGERFFFLTTHQAPRGRVVAIDLARPGVEDWQEVVPQGESVIESVTLAGQRLFVEVIRELHSELRQYDLDGRQLENVPVPGTGSVSGLSGRPADDRIYFSYTDFTTPSTVFRHDIVSGNTSALRKPATGLRADDFRTEQVYYRSADGTQVPMTIVSPRAMAHGSPGPLVLYGYGGFGVSLLPAYSTSRAAWLMAGGRYAVANLRGGGEFGDEWHRAGTRLNKQKVFDDFIAAAQWLIQNKYSTATQLAIWGGSNGGLLVAAVAQQRPDLFAAAVPAVGVLDMLRYQVSSGNARQWSSDYGLSENADEFAALYAYSPLHNLQKGSCYPATLVMADANDDRVAPWHSYKYAAALQHTQGCDRPVLIRVETNTGHGAGASVSKIIGEYADQWAFVAAQTGLDP